MKNVKDRMCIDLPMHAHVFMGFTAIERANRKQSFNISVKSYISSLLNGLGIMC